MHTPDTIYPPPAGSLSQRIPPGLRNPARALAPWFVFPILPVLVYVLVVALCWDIWMDVTYGDGRDIGEAIVFTFGVLFPMIVILATPILAALTGLGRALLRRSSWSLYGKLARGLLVVLRLLVLALALFCFVVAATFFMGDETGVLRHWEVALSWVLVLASCGVVLKQQWQRVRMLWPSA